MKVKPNVNSVRVFMFHPELYQDFDECCFGGPLVGSIGSIRPVKNILLLTLVVCFWEKKNVILFIKFFGNYYIVL